MLNRSIEAELLPYCEENDIGIIAYSPMQKGLLSGKVTPEWAATLPADDHRRADQPRVTAAIVGARKPGQIKETVFGGKFAIKPEDLARIEEALVVRG
jgi:aryl-alcohol dehydrogenase-like predicted oxidoreductase